MTKTSVDITAKNCNDMPKSQRREYKERYSNAIFNLRHKFDYEDSSGKKHYVDKSTGYTHLDNILDLYMRWYTLKIFQKSTSHAHDVKQIINTLYAFVILYGYNLEKNTMDEFLNPINDFLDKSEKGDVTNKTYLQPWCITDFLRNLGHQKEYFTETGLILWHLLLQADNARMDKFCATNNKYADMLKSDGLDIWYEDNAPEIYDKFQGIDDEDYIYEHGLTRSDVV
jgi:hypothetical protein